MLSVVIPSIIVLSVVMLSVIMLSIILLSIILLTAVVLRAVKLTVIALSTVKLNNRYTECRSSQFKGHGILLESGRLNTFNLHVITFLGLLHWLLCTFQFSQCTLFVRLQWSCSCVFWSCWLCFRPNYGGLGFRLGLE